MSSGLQVSIAHSASLKSNYAHLIELDRAGWAWKWLRCNPSFASQRLAMIQTISSMVIQPKVALESSLLRWGIHFG